MVDRRAWAVSVVAFMLGATAEKYIHYSQAAPAPAVEMITIAWDGTAADYYDLCINGDDIAPQCRELETVATKKADAPGAASFTAKIAKNETAVAYGVRSCDVDGPWTRCSAITWIRK